MDKALLVMVIISAHVEQSVLSIVAHTRNERQPFSAVGLTLLGKGYSPSRMAMVETPVVRMRFQHSHRFFRTGFQIGIGLR